MDALEFLKERKRMCNYYSHCKGARLTEANALLTMLSPMKIAKDSPLPLSNGRRNTRARRGRACFWSSSQTSGLT